MNGYSLTHHPGLRVAFMADVSTPAYCLGISANYCFALTGPQAEAEDCRARRVLGLVFCSPCKWHLICIVHDGLDDVY